MKYHLICNPGANSSRGRAKAEAYKELLRRREVAFTCASSKSLDHCTDLAREAMTESRDVIVAVGGDGTINRVINGLFHSDGSGGDRVFGVLYTGTSPDFCRFHGIPIEPERAVDSLLADRTRRVDLCRIHLHDRAGQAFVRYFTCSANLGLGPAIARRANRLRARLGDFMGTLVATVMAVCKSPRPDMQVTIGEKSIPLNRLFNISVGKNPYLAGGLKLDLDIMPSDGRIFCFGVGGVSRLALLMALPKIYSGAVTRDSRFMRIFSNQSISLESKIARVEVEFDGDPAGWCPARIDLLEQCLVLKGAES